ncbi:hypothetical protein VRK_29510 [Vibrio sp. MEBiC08052]|nr:hypothetical protein VRK_29510 [Vibrio sp. MEBiC08052]
MAALQWLDRIWGIKISPRLTKARNVRAVATSPAWQDSQPFGVAGDD